MCDLADLNFFDASPTMSAWRWLYTSIRDVLPGAIFRDLHSLTYCSPQVMRELLKHERSYLLKSGVPKRDIVGALSMSNLNAGPMEGKWIPRHKILITREASR